MIVINFKNYKKGKESLELAKRIQEYLPKAIVCPTVKDVELVKEGTKLKVFSQYIVKENVDGSLLNHSDHRVSAKVIEKNVKGKVILCVKNVAEAEKYRKLKPWAIAFEDEKLIGSGKSITSYKKEDVGDFVKLLKGSGIIPLCGAGISSVEDVRAAKKLGCRGVLIASAIAKVSLEESEKLLREISKV
jgi:triosephosphate isomerase (TIM)